MSDDSLLPFDFPAVEGKKVIAAFDGGRITSDGGVMLLGVVERQLGIAQTLARLLNATVGAIQHWERGRNSPDLARLLALVDDPDAVRRERRGSRSVQL